jgi:hypothetical protein
MFLPINNTDVIDSIYEAARAADVKILETKVIRRRNGDAEMYKITLDKSFKLGNDVIYPTVTWRNRNDGKTAGTFKFGAFRLICSNGLSIPVEGVDTMDLRIIHRDCKPTHQKLSTLLDNLIAAIKRVDTYMTALVAKEEALTAKVDNVVALKIVKGLGLSKRVIKNAELALANPKREEDATGTYWALFNIVQEEMMASSRGGAAAELRNEKLYAKFEEQMKLAA